MKAVQNILSEFKKKSFKPVYWLEGEEEYFIDQIIDHAEHRILPESEAAFNLSVFYGRDADWTAVINACRRYPMFAERSVVIIKEAQAMRDIDKLDAYIQQPLNTTILFVAYKGKKIDGRTKLAKTLKEKCVLLTTKKLYENELPDWINALATAKGYTISHKALSLFIDHIGNDLCRISNEIEKIALNLENRRTITEDDIEKFVGISKEYNVFELQDAIGKRDFYKAIRIAQYFESNPKAGPLQLIFPSLYGFFSKLQMIQHAGSADRSLAGAIGVPEWKIREYVHAAQKYSMVSVEKNILLLHHYNLRSIGVHDAGTPDGQLLKELIAKMLTD